MREGRESSNEVKGVKSTTGVEGGGGWWCSHEKGRSLLDGGLTEAERSLRRLHNIAIRRSAGYRNVASRTGISFFCLFVVLTDFPSVTHSF